jgi:hypothetical protein
MVPKFRTSEVGSRRASGVLPSRASRENEVPSFLRRPPFDGRRRSYALHGPAWKRQVSQGSFNWGHSAVDPPNVRNGFACEANPLNYSATTVRQTVDDHRVAIAPSPTIAAVAMMGPIAMPRNMPYMTLAVHTMVKLHGSIPSM